MYPSVMRRVVLTTANFASSTRTHVVWQGSVGDRRPYADQTVFWEPAAACPHFDLPWIGCMEFRLTYSAIAAPTASLISTVLG